jgi:hypothetical protein
MPRSSPRPSSAIRTTRKAIKEGRVPEDWKEKPAKLAQKDRDARWTIKYTTAKPKEDGAPQVDVAVPAFGYKNHVSIDRAYGLIRKWTATQHRVFGAGAIHWPHEFEYRSSLFKMPSAISFSI